MGTKKRTTYYNNISNVLLKETKKKKRRRQIQKEKKSKVCGASSNSNTICINVFHNRHDFLFHRLTIVSNHKYYYNMKKQEKNTSKYLNTVTITNKLSSPSSLCAKPRSRLQSASRYCIACMRRTPCELCKGGTI